MSCRPKTLRLVALLAMLNGALNASDNILTETSSGNSQSDRKPNVLVVLTDDQGWGDLSLHGNANLQTPHLDQLALGGAQLKHFYVCPVCSPTRAELLTGRWHLRGGVRNVTSGGERLNLDEVTLANLFQKAGYRTGLFGKWHNGTQGPYHPLARGFEKFYGFTSGHWGHYFSPMLEDDDDLTTGDGYLPDDLTNHALQFIQNDPEQPFFCVLTLNTPHSPMQVPDVWWQRVAERTLELRGVQPQKEDLQFTRAALAMCENIDWNVGRLIQQLDRQGISNDTIIVFFHDNGPNSNRWNGGMRGQKGSTDEGGVRSPCFIHWPAKIPAGTVIESIAGAVDLLPTLAELAGVPVEGTQPLDGMSLASQLRNDSTSRERENQEQKDRMLFAHWGGRVSVRTQQFRLDDSGRLYDLQKDPGQQKDVKTEFPEVHSRLMDAVSHWKAELVEPVVGKRDTRPLAIADAQGNRTTMFPARDAELVGGLKRSSRHPNCSFVSQWATTDDEIFWFIENPEAGYFDVELLYCCSALNIGSTVDIRVRSNNEETLAASFQVDRPAEAPLVGAEQDRVLRTESPVKDFSRLKVARVTLPKGPFQLVLKAKHITAENVMEFRSLILRRQ